MASNREIYNIEKISHGPYDIWKIYERYEAAMYLVCGSERHARGHGTDLRRSGTGKAI